MEYGIFNDGLMIDGPFHTLAEAKLTLALWPADEPGEVRALKAPPAPTTLEKLWFPNDAAVKRDWIRKARRNEARARRAERAASERHPDDTLRRSYESLARSARRIAKDARMMAKTL